MKKKKLEECNVELMDKTYTLLENCHLQTYIRINPMVKYIHKYADKKILSIYIEGIMKGITMEFKKIKSYCSYLYQ
jgi:hypothetical protein